MYGQPGYNQPYPNQPMYQNQPYPQPGMMGPPMGPQPRYQQISVGEGIDMNEYNRIVQCATGVYQNGARPLSTNTANAIKQMLGGDWLVVCHPLSRPYDFTLTTVKGGDFMVFSLDQTKYQVVRLR